VELLKAQIKAAGGMLDGIIVWGDVAYKDGMLFSPEYWRKYFKPGVEAMIDVCHENNIPFMYHGCGDVHAIFDDFIEMEVEAYHPGSFITIPYHYDSFGIYPYNSVRLL
jgi:hypothetical protein